MKHPHVLVLALLLGAAPLIAGCAPSGSDDPKDGAGGATWLGQTVRGATDEARAALASEAISVGDTSDGKPKAKISPEGELLIDDEPVPATPEQRELLLEHRANIVALAEAGIAIGATGADLGVRAATGALKHAFSGGNSDFEEQMQAEAEKIKAEARQLCDLMPNVIGSQDRLAAAMPDFAPYATITADDVDSCHSGLEDEATAAR